MKKSVEMKQKLETLRNDVEKILNEGKTAEAEEKMKELRDYKKQIQLQEELEADEEKELEEKTIQDRAAVQTEQETAKTANAANTIRAIIKKMTRKSLTDAENALLLPTTENTSGENGEGYIIPQDIRTTIIRKMRELKSARTIVGEMAVSGLTGSIPIENFETLTELVDFADGTDGTEQTEVKFKNITFSLKEKAAFMKLSNTLINLSDENLVAYIAEIFAKKAVLTENKIIFETLKKGKSVKTIADWKALKSSINKDLDPSSLYNTVIVTNQDGWDKLDSAVDGQGRPILQPDPTNPTRKFLGGYPVEVFSNALFPTTASKIPFIYGNLKDAVKVCDLNRMAFATSTEAGFMSNTTIARIIEFIDVIQCDESDKCYIYAEMPVGE